VLNLLVVIILSYLVGSFPTGILAGKLFKKIDIREHGSGNSGATNSFRVLGWKLGVIVALVDMLKGFVAVAFISRITLFDATIQPDSVLFIAATLASVAGHVKPLFARFRGGRGFGTAVGAVTAQVPLVFPLCLLVFFIVLGFTGYVSVCAAAAAFSLPVFYLLISLLTDTPFDPVTMGFFIFAFLATLAGVRKKLLLYIRGEAELFEKVMIFRK
jgi:acyl phosphate:glycerol-3-phosphate acyltransferase